MLLAQNMKMLDLDSTPFLWLYHLNSMWTLYWSQENSRWSDHVTFDGDQTDSAERERKARQIPRWQNLQMVQKKIYKGFTPCSSNATDSQLSSRPSDTGKKILSLLAAKLGPGSFFSWDWRSAGIGVRYRTVCERDHQVMCAPLRDETIARQLSEARLARLSSRAKIGPTGPSFARL